MGQTNRGQLYATYHTAITLQIHIQLGDVLYTPLLGHTTCIGAGEGGLALPICLLSSNGYIGNQPHEKK